MKIPIIGDPHAEKKNLDLIRDLFQLVHEEFNYPEKVIILGDLLHTKELVSGKCLNTYIDIFEKTPDTHYYILVGNHDWFNHDCKEHSLVPLSRLDNVTVIDKPITLRIKGLPIRFVPYIHDTMEFRKAINALTRVLFCHADIHGFDYGNGHISECDIKIEDFVQNVVISGHYHKYQKVKNITYLGTPFSHSFGETNQIKYIGLFDTDTLEMELIETPFPKHMTYEIDADSKELTKHPIGYASPTDFNRVIIKGSPENIAKIDKGGDFKYIEKPTQNSADLAIDEEASPDQQFTKWAQDIAKLEPETVNLGLEILKDVR